LDSNFHAASVGRKVFGDFRAAIAAPAAFAAGGIRLAGASWAVGRSFDRAGHQSGCGWNATESPFAGAVRIAGIRFGSKLATVGARRAERLQSTFRDRASSLARQLAYR